MEKHGFFYELLNKALTAIENKNGELTSEEYETAKKMYFALQDPLHFSKHSAWKVDWLLEKWDDTKDTLKEVVDLGSETFTTKDLVFGGNIVLDSGANEMLKLIAGDTSATPYNYTNAKIFVGTDSTAESASQTGVIASGANRAYASMDVGYPVVSNRTLTFRASFDNNTANFEWNEAAITNGTGVGNVAINRKVSSMGTKNGGTWTLQISISLVSA